MRRNANSLQKQSCNVKCPHILLSNLANDTDQVYGNLVISAYSDNVDLALSNLLAVFLTSRPPNLSEHYMLCKIMQYRSYHE